MASLQRVRVHGHAYWRIVESRRINGRPRPIVVAHLGKADDLLARLRALETLGVRSLSHGAVAAIYALAGELDLAGTIDRHLDASGRRDRVSASHLLDPERAPKRSDGLTVGQSLALLCVGRACHATSKRGFAEWAKTTTLGEIAGVDLDRLTSQHFWDQMDQVPIEILPDIEREVVARAVEAFQLPIDTVLYDATNFFTFIASTNSRCDLPARGHNKQKRHDLRQLGLALLCTREHEVPLAHMLYGGQVPDARSFAEILPRIRQRMVDLGRDLDALTIVYDRGNVSRANQRMVDRTRLHYVASLTASSQRALIAEANGRLEPVTIREGETVCAYRTRRSIWGAERTAVVLVSETLRAAQLRGVLQHVASARRWLDGLAAMLARGRQRRDRTRLERDIETRLMGRQHLRRVLRVTMSGRGRRLRLTHDVDQEALRTLDREWLGRLVLTTDRDDWSTAEIIRAYRGQSHVEAAFRHIKNPVHVMLRPQYHWTDQKLHVHAFTCVLSYLLARLLHRRAQQLAGYAGSVEGLLDTLANVRRVRVVRSAAPRSLRVTTQLEQLEASTQALVSALGIRG